MLVHRHGNFQQYLTVFFNPEIACLALFKPFRISLPLLNELTMIRSLFAELHYNTLVLVPFNAFALRTSSWVTYAFTILIIFSVFFTALCIDQQNNLYFQDLLQ